MKGQADISTNAMDINRIRQQFPLLASTAHGQPLVYLDNAATTQKPLSVIKAVDHYYRAQNANVHRAAHYLSACTTHAFEAARETVRRFINARFDQEIIWTRGATEAINLVANSWGRSVLNAGDEIILSRLEHHANIVPWQLVAQTVGATIKVAELDSEGNLNLQHFKTLLSKKTKLVAIAHASNAIGTILPVKTVIELAHEAGALVLVDGSQAVAHEPVDVQALDADFYVFSGHKVYGPTGIGILYGRKALLESMPPWQAGGEMVERVSFSGTRFNSLPFKFEAGTPNIAGAIGLSKALEFLSAIDPTTLQAHENELRQQTEQGLKQIKGVRLIGQAQRKAPVVSFVSTVIHNQDLGLMLDQQGIAVRIGHHCAMPLMEGLGLSGTVRASFALYNAQAEVTTFLEAMEKLHHSPIYKGDFADDAAKKPVNPNSTRADLPAMFRQSTPSLATVSSRLNGQPGWQERYRQIMLLGKELPVLELKDDNARLHGCESSVWLHYHYDDNTMRLFFIADSDARVIRGLIAIVLAVFSGKTPKEIQGENIEQWFRELDLFNHLSPSRGNGLKAIVKEIQAIAHRYQ